MSLKNVSKGYGDEWDFEQVLGNLSLVLEPGKLTVVVGPSGCGKSTLVNLIAGFEMPDEGEILLDGQTVTGPGKDRMVVFQETALMPWQTTYQNIVFGPKLRGDLNGKALEQEAIRLIEKVGLAEFRDKYPLQLSGGMQRRAELARALINDPRIMIMDEPFRGLDAMSRELMQEFFLKIFEENRKDTSLCDLRDRGSDFPGGSSGNLVQQACRSSKGYRHQPATATRFQDDEFA